ncbi:MAG: G1 family glutamic endopeptidase [Actinomycetota bacterium]
MTAYGRPLKQDRSAAPPCVTDRIAPPTSSNSNIWAGRLAWGSEIRRVVGRWTQPNFVSYCAHASNRAIWNGIGGVGVSKLIQAGSMTIDTSGSNINAVKAFVEVFDLEPAIAVAQPAISAGDLVSVDTSYATSGGGTATWAFSNLSTGVAQVWFNRAFQPGTTDRLLSTSTSGCSVQTATYICYVSRQTSPSGLVNTSMGFKLTITRRPMSL